eukprot:3282173-Rhodomonas_salina.2
MENFRPNAILMQCGTDSLVGDRLGTFNLTLRGHGKCVEFMNSFGVPMLLVGGGGAPLPPDLATVERGVTCLLCARIHNPQRLAVLGLRDGDDGWEAGDADDDDDDDDDDGHDHDDDDDDDDA